MTDELKPLPCPFCGEVGLEFGEGSTFRWLASCCKGCGATRGETRIQTIGEGIPDVWRKEAERCAIAEWNQRADPLKHLNGLADEIGQRLDDPICMSCETLSHCRKHGCIPISEK